MDHLGTNGDGQYCVVEEEQILKTIVLYCWPYEARFGDAHKAARLAEATLTRWLAQGLPYRLVDGQRRFDLCQVINFMKWTADRHGDPAYEGGAVPTWRRSLRTLVPDDWLNRREASELPPRRFVVTFRREFNLQEAPPGKPVRLRLPLPFEDLTQSGITLEHVATSCRNAHVSQLPGRLEVMPAGLEPAALEFVEYRVAFTAQAPAFALEPNRLEEWDRQSPDYQLYTRPSEGLIQVTSSVSRLASELAGHSPSPWHAVIAFWAFFFAAMKAGSIHHDELDPTDLLGSLVRRGWFDCLTGSALLAGLCRARGIPARLVHGVLLYPFASSHYWTEILLPPYGWVPVDLSQWILAAGRSANLPWSRVFLGRLDYRMKTECLPRLVVGRPAIRFPAQWYVVPNLAEEGSEVAYYGLASGQLLYRDRIRVELPVPDLPGSPLRS